MDIFENLREIGEISGREFETRCRYFCNFANLSNDTGLCRVLTRHKIYVDLRDRGIAPHFIMDGFWETWLSQCLAQIVKPGDVCLDLGANFGYFTLLMSGLAGAEGRTIAVEPNPRMAELLRRTAEVNGPGFKVAECAVSDKAGEITLYIPGDSFGDASLLKRVDRAGKPSESVTVRAMTIDELVKEYALPKVDVIKMDVEGVESLVFDGMKKTMADNPSLKIIIEYSPFFYKDAEGFTKFLFENFTVNRIKDVDRSTRLDESAIPGLLTLKDHTDLYLEPKVPAVVEPTIQPAVPNSTEATR